MVIFVFLRVFPGNLECEDAVQDVFYGGGGAVDYAYTYVECNGMLFVRRQVKIKY